MSEKDRYYILVCIPLYGRSLRVHSEVWVSKITPSPCICTYCGYTDRKPEVREVFSSTMTHWVLGVVFSMTSVSDRTHWILGGPFVSVKVVCPVRFPNLRWRVLGPCFRFGRDLSQLKSDGHSNRRFSEFYT